MAAPHRLCEGPPLALTLGLLACSCGGDRAPLLAPPAPTVAPAESAAVVPRPPRRTRPPRPSAPSKPPCELAAELRRRVPGLLSEGRLLRAARALARARALCPAGASEAWAVEVGTLTELGALREARALAETILASGEAPAEARRAASSALSEVTRLSRAPGSPARKVAREAYAEAAAALLGHDAQAAERAALKAWAAYHPNPDALYLAGLAARDRGDVPAAQRRFDRARVESNRGADCTLDRPCGGGVKLLESDPLHGDVALLASPASSLVAAIVPGWGVRILGADGRTRAVLDHADAPAASGMAFSPDGRRLLRVPRDPSACACAAEIYDAETGLLLRQLLGTVEDGGMRLLGLSPDGRRLAGVVVGKHPELRVLDVERERAVWSTRIPDWPRWIGYTGDGRSIATMSRDEGLHEVRLHDAQTGRRAPLGNAGNPRFTLAASPDGAHLAGLFGDEYRDAELRLLDLRAGKLTVTFEPVKGAPRALAFSPSGHRVAHTHAYGVLIGDVATGKTVASFAPPDPPGEVDGAAFLDDRRLWIHGGDVFWEWEIGAGAPRRALGSAVTHHARAAFSPVNERIASGLEDGDVALWDPGSPALFRRLAGHTGAVTALAFSGDGAALFSASRDGTVRRWEVPSGRPLQVLSGHAGPVTALAVSPDDRTLASGAEDGTVRLWDPATGAETRRLPHPGEVRALAFSPDGRKLLTGADDGALRVLDSASGSLLGSASLGVPVKLVSWSAGAEILVVAAAKDTDAHAFRWSTPGGAPQAIQGLTGAAHAAAISDDGRALALASAGGREALRLFDPKSGARAGDFHHWISRISGVALRDDAEWLALATSHGVTLFRRGAEGPEVTLSAAPGLTAVMVETPDGYFDVTGPDPDALRRLSRCGGRLPVDLCEEQFRVPGLLAKVMAGDESFRDP